MNNALENLLYQGFIIYIKKKVKGKSKGENNVKKSKEKKKC